MSWIPASFFKTNSSIDSTNEQLNKKRSRFRKKDKTRPTLENLENRAVNANAMTLGMNLESIVDWSPAWTFTDAFKTSRPWVSHAYNTVTGAESWEGGGVVNVDSKGWPTQLNQWTNSQGQVMQQRLGTLMFRDIGTAYPAGTYRAEWEGTGAVSWGFAARVIEQGKTATGKNYALLNVTPSADGVYMKISSMSSSDPVRNIHVWMPDANGQSFAGQVWQPGASFSPFHPTFMEKLAPFKTLRFMDWSETNVTDVVNWSDRRSYDYATQQSGDFHNGIALEYMIELCNELDADAWFNMPHAASDDFVRQFATMVRDTLEPGRKAYIEWSNEVWNSGWGFESYPWVTQQLALPENAYLNGDRWAFVGREAKRDFDIWSNVFAGQTNRIVRVVAGQQANSWIAGQIASNMGGSFDAISSAAYMYVSDADRASFSSATTSDQVVDALVRNMPQSLQWVQNHKSLANSLSTSLGRPISFVAYEGGPHLDSWGASYQQAFFDAGNNPRMRDAYTQMLTGAQASGLEMFAHYNLTGGLYPSSFGAFGALQSMYQTTSTAPKYKALIDFAGSTVPVLPQVYLETLIANASENGPTAGQWRISRTGATDASLTVNLNLSGSASAADYQNIPNSISFAPGEASKIINLIPVDDQIAESTEQVVLGLASGSGYQVDTTRQTGTISITDNDYVINQGLYAYYYDSKYLTNLKFNRIDPTINFNWGTGSPASSIKKDNFSVRWTGRLQAVEGGNYVLRTLSDDGVRLWINGVQMINNWTNHNATYNRTAPIYIAAGAKVDIRLEYYESTQSSVIRLEWLRPGQSAYQVVPQSQLTAPTLMSGASASSSANEVSVKMASFAAPLEPASNNVAAFRVKQSSAASLKKSLAGKMTRR